MRSPFPGMDPYLEDRWRDVHSSLVLYTRNQLQPQVMPRYRARVEERVVLDTSEDDRTPPSYKPDVKIVRGRSDGSPSTPALDDAIAVAEPVVVIVPRPEETTETFVQIVDPATGGRVVTVIEFLSPTNKRAGADLDAYVKKQRQLVNSDVSLVEIDLLRGGTRTTSFAYGHWPRETRRHYAACVARPSEERRAELYGFDLRERLPAIRIPLRAGERDAILDLQKLIDQAYVDGGYDDLDYAQPPVPPLTPADEAWAAALLHAAGRRS